MGLSRINLLERCNEELRRIHLDEAKKRGYTGWENATLDDVAHVQVNSRQVRALIEALQSVIDDIRYELSDFDDALRTRDLR